jgi:hypothetical protein
MSDDKYRIEEERRTQKRMSTIEVNPIVIFPEDEEESEPPLSVDEDVSLRLMCLLAMTQKNGES